MQCGRDLCDGRQEKRGEEVMEEARRGGGDGDGALAGDRGARVSAADTGVSSDTDVSDKDRGGRNKRWWKGVAPNRVTWRRVGQPKRRGVGQMREEEGFLIETKEAAVVAGAEAERQQWPW
jgi:hypothetical protein